MLMFETKVVCYDDIPMAVLAGQLWTFEAVEALEKRTEERFELIEGQIYMMSGGSVEHATVIANVIGQLYIQLKGSDCYPRSSDLKTAVRDDESFRYPDLSVVCGKVQTDDKGRITNPTVLIEVTSPSTRDIDLKVKAEEYLKIDTLQSYLVIDLQDRQLVTFERDSLIPRYNLAEIPGIDARLDLEEIFSLSDV